jgi:repressor LexA
MYSKYAAIRDEKGLNDSMVAKETGIAPSVIYDWKAGRSTPKADKLKKLAEYFGVSIESFLE